MLAGVLAGCGSDYDEAAHRAAYEEALGHPVGDWGTSLELGREFCGYDEYEFGLQAAVMADAGQLETFRLHVEFLCPDRLDEVRRATG